MGSVIAAILEGQSRPTFEVEQGPRQRAQQMKLEQIKDISVILEKSHWQQLHKSHDLFFLWR